MQEPSAHQEQLMKILLYGDLGIQPILQPMLPVDTLQQQVVLIHWHCIHSSVMYSSRYWKV
jgi:hypothetical protein